MSLWKVITLCTIVLAVGATAQVASQPQQPSAQTALMAAAAAPVRDARLDTLTGDLTAISRIATLSKDLADNRQVMLAMIDADTEALRDPRGDGTYRWASLQREEASRVKDEKTIERVQTEKELREVTISATNAYRVEVLVPTKRNLVSANNRVYVRNVLVDSTGFDGKTLHHEIPVNAWINPGDANGVALPDIGKSVKATAQLGVESGDKRAVAQVALVQAKLVDDPQSPFFPAVKRLAVVRDLIAAKDINRGQLRNSVDEALLAIPGELDKRAAAQAAAAEQRKSDLAAGVTKGAFAAGDAAPDVVAALREISRLSGGTLQEQTDARAKLQSVIETLDPKPVAVPVAKP